MVEQKTTRYDSEFYEHWTRVSEVEFMALVDRFHFVAAESDYEEAKIKAKKSISYDGIVDDFDAWEDLQLTRERYISSESTIRMRRTEVRGYNKAYSKVVDDLDKLTQFYSDGKNPDPEGTAIGWVYDLLRRSSAL